MLVVDIVVVVVVFVVAAAAGLPLGSSLDLLNFEHKSITIWIF